MVGRDNRTVGLLLTLFEGFCTDEDFVEQVLPIATALSGVNMRLLPGAYRYVDYLCMVHRKS